MTEDVFIPRRRTAKEREAFRQGFGEALRMVEFTTEEKGGCECVKKSLESLLYAMRLAHKGMRDK